jgi:glycosyltransferase involved in cell wall biosynthesis
MAAMLFVLTVPAALYTLYAVYALFRTVASARALPTHVDPPKRWPRVSIIVPACNEKDTVHDATRTKLASDYPDLEIVLVDDRSTDGTSEIADRLAREDRRVRVVHVKELPEGWLGKLHALECGVKEATGEFLLFSDADVHMDKDLLRRVLGIAENERLDFVALFPHVRSSSWGLDVVLSAMLRQLITAGRVWKVPDPRSRVSIGSGVFNLVRRAAYDKTKGFSWLRLEIVDDVALGQMMKHSGARCAILNARDSLALHFYRSLGEMMRGIEKNGFSVIGQLRLHRALIAAALLTLLEAGPAAAIVMSSTPPWQRIGAAATLATMSLVQAGVAWWGKRPLSSALVPLAGALVCLFFMMRSVVLVQLRGGVMWRGTTYPLRALKDGLRIEV